MKKKASHSWTVFGLSNFSYDILDAIESINGEITQFVVNIEVDKQILVRIPKHIKQISLSEFRPSTDNYFIGFMDHHKDGLLHDLEKYQLTFANLIHSKAYVSEYTILGQGNFIGANATLAPMVKFGDFNFINRNASVGHHTVIHNRNKTGPGATISSLCKIGNNNTFGSNSTILPQLEIPNNITIAAGAVVINSIREKGTYVGVPAKKLLS